MSNHAPPVIPPSPPPRRSRWAYWVVVPICALAYTAFCLWFSLEAWGRRGEPKPAWFHAAGVLVFPTMIIPVPVIGPLVLGAGAGCGLVQLARRMRR